MANKKTKDTTLPTGVITDKNVLTSLKKSIDKYATKAQERQQETSRRSNIHIASSNIGNIKNMMTVDPISPINLGYDNSIYVDLKGQWYVPFLNPDDNEDLQLIANRKLSPTTDRIIQSKINYCLGNDGVYISDKNTLESKIELNKKFKAEMQCINNNRESLDDVCYKIFDSYLTFGNVYIEIVRGQVKVGDVTKRYMKVYVRHPRDCRLAYPDKYNICNNVIVSRYFRKEGGIRLKPDFETKVIPIFVPTEIGELTSWWKNEEDGTEHTMIHIKNSDFANDYYGLPSNHPSKTNMQREYRNIRYDLDMFENKMILGGILNVKSDMPDEDGRALANELTKQYVGDGKRGQTMVITNQSQVDKNIEYIPFHHKDDDNSVTKATYNDDKIFMANGYNRELIGSNSPNGTFKSSAEIRTIFQIVLNTCIVPDQNKVINGFLKPFISMYSKWCDNNWHTEEFGFNTVMPSTFLGDIDPMSALKVNEGRHIIGYPKLDDERGETLMREIKNANPLLKGQTNEEGNRDGNEPPQNR